MKRLLATATITALAPLAFATPAHAENPYATGDLSTLPACTWNYWRVVSIAEGNAARMGDLDYRLQQAQDTVDRQAATIDDQADRIDQQADAIERMGHTINRDAHWIQRLRHRVVVLRARLEARR